MSEDSVQLSARTGDDAQRPLPPVPESVGDPLREVRVLKRRVQLFVYLAIFGSEPLYYFVLDYTIEQMIPGLFIGLLIAFSAIEGAFYQMFRLRKRSGYPRVLHQELGAVGTEQAARERGLAVIAYLLRAEHADLVLGSPNDLTVEAALTDGAQKRFSRNRMRAYEAMQTGEPVRGDRKASRTAVVPLVALKHTAGVLILTGDKKSDFGDLQLQKDIGVALALSLENWSQRDELQKSEDRLKRVVGNVPVVLFAIDTNKTFTLSEGVGLEDLGLKPGEVVGMSAGDVYAEYPRIIGNIERALNGESFTDLVEVEGLWWETSYSPVFDQSGNVSGIIGVAANVTGRKHAEDGLRKSEELYRTLVETSPDAVFLVSAEAKVVKTNLKAAELAGYDSPNDLEGAEASQFFSEEDFGRIGERMNAPETVSSEMEKPYELVRKDGTRVPVEINLAELRDSVGNNAGYIGVARDVTERIAAQRALRQSEEKYRDLVENSNEIIFTLDASAVVTYISPAVEPIGGYTPDEVIGRSSTEFIHPDDLPLVAESLQKVLQGNMDPSEYRLRMKSGEYRWVRSASKPIYEGDEIVGVRGVLVDITERKAAEEALRGSERRFRALVDNSSDGVALFDAQGTLTYVGPTTPRILGYEVDEAVGLNGFDLVHPDDVEAVASAVAGLAGKPGESTTVECRLRRKDGELIWLEAVITNLIDEPSVGALVGNYRDITERKLAEEALVRSEESHRALATAIPDMMLRVRTDGLVSAFMNDEGHTLSLPETLPDEITLTEILPEHASQFTRHVDIAVSTRETQVFEYQQAVDGKPHEFEARIVASSDDEAVAIVRDITERKNSERIIRQLAYHDALTGLPNRALFEDRLKMAVAQAKRSKTMIAVMFLDLDRFKLVNDTLGHGAGDKLLCMVADQLSGLLRDGDTVARVGGDEFTLLLPGISNATDAIDVANRILQSLKAPKLIGGQEFRVTTSIGLTMFPEDGEDPEALLRNADTAMYRAKERGRDNYQLYTPSMNASVVERLSLEADLRRALERDEFVVYYQPIANIADGRFVGAEALVRWNHPERGMVQPDDFIPFSEETGMIIPLGEWVLKEACCEAKAWIDEGLPELRLTVNLSARQLQDEDLVKIVSNALRDCGLPPERLQLEITEGAMMHNVDSAIKILKELRHLGVGVAVDDFGTGYSSLSYLKRFPIDTVKIDRSFVRDLTIDPNDAAIVTTVLAMASNLGLKVVAEGVETRQQLEFLREKGCNEFQGYLLSRPITAKEFSKLVTSAETARPRKRAAAR